MSDFVDFNLAKKLKEKGFKFNKDYRLDRFFMSNEVNAPTISQVLKWLREEKNLSVEPYSCACGWRVTICKTGDVLDGYVSGGTCVKNEVEGYNDGGAFNLYEEAAIAGIEYVLDNLI